MNLREIETLDNDAMNGRVAGLVSSAGIIDN
jgi:hypothetical protein